LSTAVGRVVHQAVLEALADPVDHLGGLEHALVKGQEQAVSLKSVNASLGSDAEEVWLGICQKEVVVVNQR
jgi:hypothetical protein